MKEGEGKGEDERRKGKKGNRLRTNSALFKLGICHYEDLACVRECTSLCLCKQDMITSCGLHCE